MATSPPFQVSILPIPAPQVTITSTPSGNLCPQQIAIFNANVVNGGTNPLYQWNINGVPSGTNQPAFSAANPSGIMTVYVTVTPNTGCPPQVSNSIVFNIRPTLSPEIYLQATVTDSICPGETVLFNVSSAFTGNPPQYAWYLNGVNVGTSNDTLVLSNLNDGDQVNVSVTSTYPCLSPAFTFADPLNYYWYPPLSGNLTDGPVEVCAGIPVTLYMDAEGGNYATRMYVWSAGNSSSGTNTFVPSQSGYYFATVDDACYDPVTDSVFIEQLPVPVAGFYWLPVQPSVFIPEVQFTDNSQDASNWMWNLGDQTISDQQHPIHTYTATGTFPVELVVTNDVGCTDTLIRILEIKDEYTVYIPNSFTPNGDGKNDYFGLTGFNTGGYTMSVFNRWGQQVFVASGPAGRWDGTNEKGESVPAGTYIYLFTVKNDSAKKPYTGTVTLIR